MSVFQESMEEKLRAVLPSGKCPSCSHNILQVSHKIVVGKFVTSEGFVENKEQGSVYTARCCRCSHEMYICDGSDPA